MINIKGWFKELSKYPNTQRLLLCFIIFLSVFIITALMHLDTVAIITGFISIILTIILTLAFLMKFSDD